MRIFIVVLLVLLSTFIAVAQQQKGDMELQLLGMYMTTTGTEYKFSMGQISGSLGYYFTNNIQLGFAPTLTITTTPSVEFIATPPFYRNVSNTETTFGGSAFFVYSFLTGNVKAVPYAGARYYKQDFSVGESSAGINAGVKFYISKKTAFDVNGNYLFQLTEGSEGGILLFGAGFSFLF